ncbi:DUF3427 domain-containing protein [Parenemella sanctibonifatiensis]|uniref:Restriction endonuclease subunit R n=1 Tax=Parenemella sanctibonifatiensis TaxID=2016505 RepID=A0A255EIK2_9ACTN|nr:DEAD/DEAH box helicase [Parenemella sanctibonifatiensis]OYN91346.1 restriction endonuclease subunit R [Parenemella sanctibonifatiensis]
MTHDFGVRDDADAARNWQQRFRADVQYGLLDLANEAPRLHHPHLVLNHLDGTVQHELVEQLRRCDSFTFSVAFVTDAAVAQLKQHLVDFTGTGRIVTSTYQDFNSPRAFAELLNLSRHSRIEVRLHQAKGFHPKGYLFHSRDSTTAIIGSSNLTSAALSANHEWNVAVSATRRSDLHRQLDRLIAEQLDHSDPLTADWIRDYQASWSPLPARFTEAPRPLSDPAADVNSHDFAITPNRMQRDALLALDLARAEGARRAIIVSATGTGKTILSALDVRAVAPRRLLFVVHREQILDRTIHEYHRVLGGPRSDYGKLTGGAREQDRRYVFATIQTLARPDVLATIAPEAFDHVIIDEAHRAGSASYQRVINRLTPDFLLGMTATPERTDGFNVFELFDHVVPYEIRLQHALEAEMLVPFHYYGIADVAGIDEHADLRRLVTPERMDRLVTTLEVYGQAGVAPRGLIFCSRTEEAHQLAEALNQRTLHGQPLRTRALTGADAVAFREEQVAALENGELDYLLTVDVFNEGVDIPSVNQVVMLRQTTSAIVFVQQLGRGLRLAPGKDYLVVIDMIGNYASNFLIPVALFGDESLNKEALRRQLTETSAATGQVPGLSSVSFDELSRQRILRAIGSARLDSYATLRVALRTLQRRVGGVPRLWDFHRFESADPVLLATRDANYPTLVRKLLKVDSGLSEDADRALALLSREAMAAKRLHELVLLSLLLDQGVVRCEEISPAFAAEGLLTGATEVTSAIDSLALRGYNAKDTAAYRSPIITELDGTLRLGEVVRREWQASEPFRVAIKDLLRTGLAVNRERYRADRRFTPGRQYTRRDAARILGWGTKVASTVYGYRTDPGRGVAALFVTLDKSPDVAARQAYHDQLLDRSSMRWYSRSNRTLTSGDTAPIADGIDLEVFVKKDDAEGAEHYYLGLAHATSSRETELPTPTGPLPVVEFVLHFDDPIPIGLYDYFTLLTDP